jgi:hypothetical protein
MTRFFLVVLAAVVVAACGRDPGPVQGTNRGELKLSLADGGAPAFDSAHNFGTVKVGESAKLTLVAENTGLDALEIRQIKIDTTETGAFFVTGGTGSVAPQAKRTYSVTYTPVRAGAQTGNLVFEHNANSESARVSLSGTAVP